jgi:hypothetical protein
MRFSPSWKAPLKAQVGATADPQGDNKKSGPGFPEPDERYKTRTCDLHDVNVAL